MEDPFDFLFDFKNIADIPVSVPETPEYNSPQEITYYIEITQGGKRAYQCTDPQCGKVFRFNSEVKRHVVIHQNDRPYSCNHKGCNKTFKRPETLEDHMRVHEGSLPFACDHTGCDRRFASTAALRYHKLIHKNNRKFKCDLEGCDRSFLTSYQLKQHQKAHPNSSSLDWLEAKPSKILKSELKKDTSDPIAKLSENIHWEMKSQKNKEASAEEKIQEHYDMIRGVLEENRRLKERLQEYEKVKPKGSFEKDNQIYLKKNNSFLSTGGAEFINFTDTYELDLLEFLKENELNNFLN